MRAALVFPHQLFAEHPALAGVQLCVLVEDPLLISQYHFHRKKLILHRASMKEFAKPDSAQRQAGSVRRKRACVDDR